MHWCAKALNCPQSEDFEVSSELSESLRCLGQRCEASLHATLLTAWMVLLSRYGQDLQRGLYVFLVFVHKFSCCLLLGYVSALGFRLGEVSLSPPTALPTKEGPPLTSAP